MPAAVDLDDQPPFDARETDGAGADGRLAAEGAAGELTGAETLPEAPFGVGREIGEAASGAGERRKGTAVGAAGSPSATAARSTSTTTCTSSAAEISIKATRSTRSSPDSYLLT